ncbi:hypothetical protein Nepgr_011793 [Nepenthes gracilis]|uniref:Uncharacterized protein n=1 Tax=Nepenthes gracilis TaxID=150966 RepID=A0AAD3SEZ9_NEPGR|nr:hypothetical protein Nepgr_011793 [Nepenthes gracilis]
MAMNDSIPQATPQPQSPQLALPAPWICFDKTHNPQTPATPSPLRMILHRLEEIDIESKELLKKLFSMLEKDMRLEAYVKRRLDDPKVSDMWRLVEVILAAKQGTISSDLLMNSVDGDGIVNNGVKTRSTDDEEGRIKLERFKVKTLGMDKDFTKV